uniref:trypsin n=1 Tax=Sinocyclocheilus rhinocerous TaxID=307959 RepID=A0A673HTK8_9TELE
MNLKLCLLLLFLCAVIIPAQVCMNSYMLIYHMLFLKYIVVHNRFLIWMKINPNPCLNGGECEEKRDKFKCKCPKQFVGRRCERGKRVCKRGTCGAGLCLLTPSPPYYKCKCIPPFAPPNCRSTAPCNPSPCQNNGRCVVDEGDFDCICPDGYSGQYCQVGPDDCYEGDGQSYRGKVSETEDGDECLDWNSEFVLDKGAFPSVAFASSEGLGPHNFCRNPDGDKKPWCFIKKDRRLRWDYCDVRKCPTPGTITTQYGSITPESTSSAQITTTPVPPTTLPKNYTLTRDFLTCGKPEPKKQVNRIYGGLKAIPGAHPWQVSVQVKPKGSIQEYRHICGGTLIKPCWVLTAAHCIDKKHDYRVILGGLNLIQKEQTDQTVLVEDTIIHEKFKETPDVVYNDIALLKLKATNGECAKETQFVKAACLPKAPFADGTECRISGWGATETSEYGSVHLLDAQVLLISQEACSSNKVYASLLDDGMFCAGYLKGGVDSCQGDSGGPLTCERNETHYIYGIVSWGDNCGEKNKPGVYTRVLKYLDWINEKISVPQ